MKFTCEDLKRLREGPFDCSSMQSMSELDDLIRRCVHRLEAAESYINGQNVVCTTCDNTLVSTDEDNRLYKAWREAKGL